MRQLPVTTTHQLPPLSPLMTPAETAQLLGVSVRQLARMRRQGTAPTHYRIDPTIIRFDRAAAHRHPPRLT